MTLIETYLKSMDNDLINILSKKKVIVYNTAEDLSKGLLRFSKPPEGKAFLFKFPKEDIISFHTIGMKFPIIIHFFDKQGKLLKTVDAKPGLKDINCNQKIKYVVEIPRTF